ncbi:MAG: hypothetical protein EBT86_12205, partial [Actinobacteria bacterium]|nr:hypothetical protein [Actinomycetota bacterium]
MSTTQYKPRIVERELRSRLESAGAVVTEGPKARLTPSPNPEPGLVRESSCPGWGWKGFSDEEAT